MPKVPKKEEPIKPRFGTDIHLSQADGESVRLFVKGEMVAEVFGGKADTKVKWEEELRHARTMRYLPRALMSFIDRLKTVHNREDHNFPKPDMKVVAFIMGLADGILGIDLPHPVNKDFEGLNLRMQRDYSPCFCEGFEHGESIRLALNVVKEKDE